MLTMPESMGYGGESSVLAWGGFCATNCGCRIPSRVSKVETMLRPYLTGWKSHRVIKPRLRKLGKPRRIEVFTESKCQSTLMRSGNHFDLLRWSYNLDSTLLDFFTPSE